MFAKVRGFARRWLLAVCWILGPNRGNLAQSAFSFSCKRRQCLLAVRSFVFNLDLVWNFLDLSRNKVIIRVCNGHLEAILLSIFESFQSNKCLKVFSVFFFRASPSILGWTTASWLEVTLFPWGRRVWRPCIKYLTGHRLQGEGEEKFRSFCPVFDSQIPYFSFTSVL